MSDTPMMKQYKHLKKKAKDAILFFRLGDFYEMFLEDAREVSSLIGLTLTKRNGVPMCGIPYHASKTYVTKLLKVGKKIAICEQVTLPRGGKGIAERQIVEVLTPGTVLEEDFLDHTSNNYLVSIGRIKQHISVSYADSSTGSFYATSFSAESCTVKIRKELARLKPKEILIQESLLEENTIAGELFEQYDILINRFPDWSFDQQASVDRLKDQFGVVNLKGFGLTEDDPALFSTGVLLDYLRDTAHNNLPQIRSLSRYNEHDILNLDEWTSKNLELTQNMYDGSKKFTLLEIVDQTKTSAGARTLKQWLTHPLQSIQEIETRQKKTSLLYHNQMLLSSLRDILGSILDIERLATRVATDRAHAKDLLAVKNSIEAVFSIEQLLSEWGFAQEFWKISSSEITNINTIVTLLDASIAEDPSIVLTEGNLIKTGYSEELDTLRELKTNSHSILNEYLKIEKQHSGISTLKIRFNKIIGYFLEVTKSNLHLVPSHFIRRQSLVGSERFTTDKLIELETELNSAHEKIIEMEKTLFLEIREEVKKVTTDLYSVADCISTLDCLCSFAYTATRNGYVCPAMSETNRLTIIDGRHPVVENHLPQGEFIPNTLELREEDTMFALITGPNMAGKSTFLRQTALIVLLAHIGSFVPASEAHIGLVDKLYCRVGATDNLARGESTFLVEMNEAAHILRSATERSLVIMDEIGRGTSTNDGLSIAWAMTEYLLDETCAKTLFATHFHELTLLKHNRLKNLYLEVVENGRDIVFLKKVQAGSANNSYGIHVAKLAGIPEEVVHRAQYILSTLEKKQIPFDASATTKPPTRGQQGELFSDQELISREILATDPDSLTPLEALQKIYEWRNRIQSLKQ